MKPLWVFDFDDTLVKTDARTHVTNQLTGAKFDLVPAEYAVYVPRPGDVFDYVDFETLINPRPIEWINKALRDVYVGFGHKAVVVLSARSSEAPIKQYLQQLDLNDIEVATVGTADPQAKADWISARITRDGLTHVDFYDDSPKNIAAIAALKSLHSTCNILTHHVVG